MNIYPIIAGELPRHVQKACVSTGVTSTIAAASPSGPGVPVFHLVVPLVQVDRDTPVGGVPPSQPSRPPKRPW